MVTPDQIEKWKAAAEHAQRFGGKWYTADELREHRAMPESDGDYIASLKPADVLALLADREELVKENEASMITIAAERERAERAETALRKAHAVLSDVSVNGYVRRAEALDIIDSWRFDRAALKETP